MMRSFSLVILSMLLASVAQAKTTYVDAAVGPWRLEAEDFVWSTYVTIWDDPAASGGQLVKRPGYKMILLQDMPFPRTGRPVSVYVRIWPAVPNERYQLMVADEKGNRRALSQFVTTDDQIGRWQWRKFDVQKAETVGSKFDIEFTRDLYGESAIDSVVISTRDNLDDAALDAAPPLFNNGPLAGAAPSMSVSGVMVTPETSRTGSLTVVARTEKAPVIDGVANDECWTSAITCSGFLRAGSNHATEADTKVRILYDKEQLYLLFESKEPTLEIVGQRRHEFAAKITDPAGSLEQDDTVVVLLEPKGEDAGRLEVAANALGTIADARVFHTTRDASWNSNAHAAGEMGDGTWTVELAVPFSDLGVSPKSGDVWRAGLGRIAHSRKEVTSWNPTADEDIRHPDPLGTLVFGGDATPGVALTPMSGLQIGENQISAALSSVSRCPSGLYLSVHLTSPDSKLRAHHYLYANASDGASNVTGSFEWMDESRQNIVYSALDAATLRPLYMSPVLSRVPRSALAQVELAVEGPFKLYLNGNLIGNGNATPEKPIPAPLQKGANTFTLTVEEGTAAIKVRTPDGSESDGRSWKVLPPDDEAVMDDSGFPLAGKTGEHAKLGAIVGEAGRPIALRRTLLWENTRIWPTPEPAYFLAQGPFAQHINVVLTGLEGRPLTGWTTYVATPSNFEIIGSSGFYANHFRCTQEGTREFAGQEMRVVRIEAGSPIIFGQHYINSMFNMFVRYQAGAPDATTRDHTFYFWSEANDGNVSEAVQSFNVRLLPPLDGRQPAKTFWEFWGGWESNMNNLAMREEIYKAAQAVGFNRIHGGFERSSSETALRYNLKSDGVVDFNPWGLNLAEYLQKHPEHRLITASGQPAQRGKGGAPYVDVMCTSHLLDKGRTVIEAGLKKILDETGAHLLNYDYEYPPWEGPHSCYCPRCLGAFREHAKLSADVALDASVIRESYGAAWADFMALRMAQACLVFKQSIKMISPETQFSIYSGYQTPEVVETEGIDWRYVGQLKACDIAVCGYGRPVEAITATRKALDGIPLVGGVIVYPYNTWETRPGVPVTKAMVLRAMLDCRGGVMFYDRLPMDGRSWQAIAEVSRLVANHEDLFISGEITDLPEVHRDAAQCISDGKVSIVCATNLGNEPLALTFRLPTSVGNGREFYTGEKVSAGQSIEHALSPGEIAVWILEK